MFLGENFFIMVKYEYEYDQKAWGDSEKKSVMNLKNRWTLNQVFKKTINKS